MFVSSVYCNTLCLPWHVFDSVALQHLVSSAWDLQGVYPPDFSFMSAPRKRGHIVVSDLDRRAAVAHGFVVHFIAVISIFIAGWCACFIWLLKLGD